MHTLQIMQNSLSSSLKRPSISRLGLYQSVKRECIPVSVREAVGHDWARHAGWNMIDGCKLGNFYFVGEFYVANFTC